MKTRTQKEINSMISKLKKYKLTVPHHSFFGDNNWAAIDIQLDVLEGIYTDEDEVYDLSELDEEDENKIEYNVLSAALDAFYWMNGDDSVMLIEDDDESESVVEKTYPTYKVSDVEKKIKVGAIDWGGNCYGIASLCLKHKVVKGKLRYGHWTGPIDRASRFARNINLGFAHHGWVELEDGSIFDPTRWSFENVRPYIYVGVNDHYDVGGNQFLYENRTEPPEFNKGERGITSVYFEGVVKTFVKELLLDDRKEDTYTPAQIHWLATLSLSELGLLAEPVYDAIIKANMGGFIPIDNRNYIMDK